MKKRRGAALITVLGLLVVVITLSVALITIYNTASKQNYTSRDHLQANLLAESGLNVFASYLSTVENKTAFNTRYINYLNANGTNANEIPLTIALDELDANPNNNAVLSITSEIPTTADSVTTTIMTVSSVGNYNGVHSNPLNVKITWVVDGTDITCSFGPYEN